MTATQPGQYLYRDPIGGPAQRIEVRKDDGELVAVFPAADGDEPAEILVSDMSGSFSRAPMEKSPRP